MGARLSLDTKGQSDALNKKDNTRTVKPITQYTYIATIRSLVALYIKSTSTYNRYTTLSDQDGFI
jgi:hypothetical protein